MDGDRKVWDGPVLPARTPYETPTGLFVLTGVLVTLGVVLGFLLSVVATGFSAMCTDDFDPSDCGSARTKAMIPVLFAIAGAVAWGVGWARRRVPSGIVWAWCGVVAGVIGVLVVFG